MSKRQHPVSTVLKLISTLTDDQKSIVRDFLKQPRSKSSAPATTAGKKSSSSKRLTAVGDQSSSTSTDAAISASGD